jgi:hypothetical protein
VAGPGGREIGRVSVRVLPDTTAFGKALARYLARIERSSRVQIRAVLDDSGLVADARALAAMAENAAKVTLPTELDDKRAEFQFRELARHLSGRSVKLDVDVNERAAEQIKQIGTSFTRLSGASLNIAGLASTAQTLAGVAAAAVQASGALLLLPAAGLAVAAVIGTLVLGFQGFGDALKSMGDPAQFAAALANLAPAAADTARSIKNLRPAFGALRLDVQQRLFTGMGATITQLANAYLPTLRTGLGGIASALNESARAFAGFLAAPQSVADTGTILDNIRAALSTLAPAGAAVAQVFRDIATVGSGFLPQLASGITRSTQRFAEFIATARQTGKLQSWISGGLSALSQMWQILKNLGSIVKSVFGALDASGGGFLAFLTDVTGKLAAFLKSAEGMAVLDALADASAAAGQAISGVFGTALAELGPVIVRLAPGFAEFVSQLSGGLVTALQIAGPLLSAFAGFLSENASWLGPIVIGLGTLAAVAGPLVSGLIMLGNAVRIVTLVFNAMKLALLSNPFTAIALAVAALAVLIITNWDSIKTWTINAFQAISAFVSRIWQSISDWVSARVSDVLAAIGWLGQLPGKVGAWFRGVYQSAVGALGDLVSWVGGLPGRILSALGDLGSLLLQTGGNIISGLLRGISNAAGRVKDFLVGLVKDAVGGVLSYLGISSPSRLMMSIGGHTAEGFAKGIADATPLAARAADRLASSATFDPVRADFGYGTTGSGSPVTVNQTINTQPEQSPWSIATAANRQLGYAMRTAGLP